MLPKLDLSPRFHNGVTGYSDKTSDALVRLVLISAEQKPGIDGLERL